MTRHPRTQAKTVSMFRSAPSVPYRVESRILQAKRGVPSLGMRSLSEAKRYAQQLVNEGADDVKIIENATGIMVKRYDQSNIADIAGKERAR